MKVLVVEDDPVASAVLAATLQKLGHESMALPDGQAAWELIQGEPLRVVISDWMMPRMDGLDLCRRIRARAADYVYFILLTNLSASAENRRAAVEAEVDDFLNKPVKADELWMRLRVAERILEFTHQVRQLEGFLPICSYCKNIRDDRNYWSRVEDYLNSRTGARLSHSICPDCYERVVVPELKRAGIKPPPPPWVDRVKK